MNASALKGLVCGIVLTTLSINHTPTWAGPPVGLIDFNSNGGGFTVVSTNNSPGPWHYDAGTGSWSASDTNDCAVPYRSSRLNSPILTVRAAGSVTLAFTHRYSFEVDMPFQRIRYDGGQLRISVNQGAYVPVPLANFTVNGYNSIVLEGGNCELAGQDAFTAQSHGYETREFITSFATLGTFNKNDTISIQFLAAWDDCSQGLVPNWEIDSVQFGPSLEPPSFSDPALPANVAVLELTSHTLQAAPVGADSLQWFKDGVAIPSAINSRYTITKMTMADAGQYFLQAINSKGTTTSRVANVTVVLDTTPPAFLSAECGPAEGQIIIHLSEPLRLDNGQGRLVTDPSVWFIERVTGPGGDPGWPFFIWPNMGGVIYNAGDTNIYMSAQSGTLNPLSTYRVVLLADMLDEAAAGNILPINSSVPIVCHQGISVGSAGAGPFTFESPPLVKQFSTFFWAGAENGVADNAALVNERVQLLSASAINMALAPLAGAPPAASRIAQWASDGKYLMTRPSGVTFPFGVAGCVVMATLQNDSGVNRTALRISYDLRVESPGVEEVPGHLVYYSMSGAPNTWLPIPGISGDSATGRKIGLLDLSNTEWNNGSTLYILWADDNGSGSPDGAIEIDNFSVSHIRPALSISSSSLNVTVTWPAGSGILQSKASLSDPVWTDVPGAGSGGSATVAASGLHKFFTLRAP